MSQIKILTDEELSIVKRNIESDPSSVKSILLEYIMVTGIRAEEALALEKSHLNDQYKAVWIIASKGSVNRMMPLSKEMYTKLKTLAANTSGDKLFPFSYQTLKMAWYNYSPKSCRGKNKSNSKGVHSLRHTFAVNLYRRCKNIRAVQVALGHKNIENTMVYMTYVETVSELRTAMGL